MLRLATIGTSVITEHFVRAVKSSTGMRVNLVYSRDPGRAAALAQELGVLATISDLKQMLGAPDVDCVYIASPNSVHSEQAIAALRAGKHVMVEKPAVPSPNGTDSSPPLPNQGPFSSRESATSTTLAPGSSATSSPDWARSAGCRFATRSVAPGTSRWTGQHVHPVLGGGALMDLGVYCVHALVTLFGEPEQVMASAVPVVTGVDGAGVALASYPGFVTDLSYSKISSSRLPSEVQGEEGTC